MTTLEVLNAAASYLGKKGIESPRLNAEHLLAHSLGKKRLDLYLEFDRPLSEAERAPLRDLVRHRSEGRPLQHLLGTSEFHGHEFLSDTRALIPRPETEHLVELVLSTLDSQPKTLIDVGTGSGIIAITLGLAWPDTAVHATDLSPDALALARENAARLSAGNVTFHETDLLPPGDDRYEVIVANLPYIPAADLPGLAREVHHDPVAALDGGPDGLDPIRHLVALAPERLLAGGHLFLELGHDQAERVVELVTTAGFMQARAHSDLSGIDRFVSARLPK